LFLLNSHVAKFCEGITTLESIGLKIAMLVDRIITAMILPGYCGKLTDIERRTGLSREAYGSLMRGESWDDSALGGYADVVAAEKAFADAK